MAEQKALVKELTGKADAIYFARAESTEQKNAAVFKILRTLKGEKPALGTLTFALPAEMVIGCFASDMFHNTHAVAGSEYVLYVVGDSLVRAGDAEREFPQISLAQELQQIRRGLKSNKTIEPTR